MFKGPKIPPAAALLNAAPSPEGRLRNACPPEGRLSEPGFDVAGWLDESGDVKEREMECRLRVLDDPEGDVLRVRDVDRDRASSVMMNSASVTRALSLLLAGTTVWVECSDSAMETGRGVRVPPDVPERGRTV